MSIVFYAPTGIISRSFISVFGISEVSMDLDTLENLLSNFYAHKPGNLGFLSMELHPDVAKFSYSKLAVKVRLTRHRQHPLPIKNMEKES